MVNNFTGAPIPYPPRERPETSEWFRRWKLSQQQHEALGLPPPKPPAQLFEALRAAQGAPSQTMSPMGAPRPEPEPGQNLARYQQERQAKEQPMQAEPVSAPRPLPGMSRHLTGSGGLPHGGAPRSATGSHNGSGGMFSGFDGEEFGERLGDLFAGWAAGGNLNESMALGGKSVMLGRAERRKERKATAELNRTRQLAIAAGMPPELAAVLDANDIGTFLTKDYQDRRTREQSATEGNKTAQFLVSKGVMSEAEAQMATPDMLRTALEIYQAQATRQPDKGTDDMQEFKFAVQNGFRGTFTEFLQQRGAQPDRGTDDMREYEFAKRNGFTGSFMDFMRLKQGNEAGPMKVAPGEKVINPATSEMLFENPAAPESYTLGPGQSRYQGDKAVASVPAAPEKPNLVTLVPPPGVKAPARTFDLSIPRESSAATHYRNRGWVERQGQSFSFDMRGENAESVAIGKGLGEKYLGLQDRAAKAIGEIEVLNAIEGTMASPDFYSGFGGEWVRLGKQAAVALGGDPSSVKDVETFNSLVKQSIISRLGNLGNQVSNADRDFYEATAPQLTKSLEGNRQLIDYSKRLRRREVEMAELAAQYRDDKGSLAGFDQFAARWATANPLFPEAGEPGGPVTPDAARQELERRRRMKQLSPSMTVTPPPYSQF